MIKLKNFSKNSFLTSFEIPVVESRSFQPKVPKTRGKKKFSAGQVRKQAKKQGIKISYDLAKKLAKAKQTKEQLYHKLYYQKQKQKEQKFKSFVKSQGNKYMDAVKRYVNLVKAEYENKPTTENLKRLHDAELLIKQARLYDERYRPYWQTFREDIKETKQRLRASRHAGNIAKPMISKAGTPMEEYVLNNFYSEVEEKINNGLDESQAINDVFQEKIADGTLEVLQQYYDTGVIYGYWDDTEKEVISPI